MTVIEKRFTELYCRSGYDQGGEIQSKWLLYTNVVALPTSPITNVEWSFNIVGYDRYYGTSISSAEVSYNSPDTTIYLRTNGIPVGADDYGGRHVTVSTINTAIQRGDTNMCLQMLVSDVCNAMAEVIGSSSYPASYFSGDPESTLMIAGYIRFTLAEIPEPENITEDELWEGLEYGQNPKVMYGNYYVNRVYKGETVHYIKDDTISGMPSFTWETPSGVTYPFKPMQQHTASLHPTFYNDSYVNAELNNSPWLISTNALQHNTYCLARFRIKNCSGGKVTFRAYQYSEKGYDYGIISKLDQTLSLSSTADSSTTTVLLTYKNVDTHTSLPRWQINSDAITIPNNSTHTFDVKFRKDSNQPTTTDGDMFAFYCYITLPDGTVVYPTTPPMPVLRFLTCTFTGTSSRMPVEVGGGTWFGIPMTCQTTIPSGATNITFTNFSRSDVYVTRDGGYTTVVANASDIAYNSSTGKYTLNGFIGSANNTISATAVCTYTI